MADESGFSSEFDAALDEVLPDDLEDVGNEEQHALTSYTIGHSRSAAENTETARAEMDRVASELKLAENVVAMGMQLFEQFQAEYSLQGRVVELVADACLYCSCKVNQIPIDPAGFSASTGELSTRKRLLRRVKAIASELGLDVAMFLDVSHYIPRYRDELGLSKAVASRAEEIVSLCDEAGLASGKSPSGWAAAAIYNAALEHGADVTQSDIAAVANVTEVTIRNRYQEQLAHVQSVDALPSDPVAVVDQIGETVSLDKDGIQVATDTVRLVEQLGLSETWDANSLAVAAVRLASKRIGSPVGYRTLNQFVDGDSAQIRSVEDEITELVRAERRMRNLVYEGGGSIPRPRAFESPYEFRAARQRILEALNATSSETVPDRWEVFETTSITAMDVERSFGTYALASLFAEYSLPADH